MLLKLQAKENGFNENNEEEILCPIANCDWSEKVNRRSSFIKHLGIFHKVLDVCYEECKEQPPPPKVNSPEPPKKKMSLSDYKKKRQTDDTQQAETGNGIKQEVKMEVETEAERKSDQLPTDQLMNDANFEKCKVCFLSGRFKDLLR